MATRARRPGSAVFHLILLGCYLVAGVAVSWPRASYLAGRLPATVDQGGYVWSFWWVAHQIAHLGNPWFTRRLAAPVGMQLGFDTLMPLLGAVMAPVTGVFGPSASYNLLAIVIPGLLCYAAYRAARLWLPSQLGAIAAGAFYGLATMLVWQDWYHINIAAGALLLPAALQAAVRLKRRPRARQAVIAGLVTGASVLVNQESAFMVALVAALVLAGWLIRDHTRANAALAGLAVAVALVVASPQLVAMIVQYRQGGAAVSPQAQARWDASFGTPLPALFAPAPRLAGFGLAGLALLFSYPHPREGAPTFGVALTALALLGLVVGWRLRGTRLLALAWLGAAALALGPVLAIGRRTFVPLPMHWHGVRVSALMPYTWFVRLPALAAFREADRLTLLGLLPAAPVWLPSPRVAAAGPRAAREAAGARASRAATSRPARWPCWRCCRCCHPCLGTGGSRCHRVPMSGPTATGWPETTWPTSASWPFPCSRWWRRWPWSGPGPGWPPALPRRPRCR